MSHAASYVAVVFFLTSIIIEIVALTSNWWTYEETGSWATSTAVVSGKISLWNIDATFSGAVGPVLPVFSSGAGGTSWDDFCDAPKLSGEHTEWCGKIKSMRAMLLLGAIFTFFAMLGLAAGIYSGNTLVDAFSGAIGTFANVCSALAIILGCLSSIDDLFVKDLQTFWTPLGASVTVNKDEGPGRDGATAGYTLALVACILQAIGGFFSCVGTCQEMHDVAKIASRVKLNQHGDPNEPTTRGEKAAKIREGEAQEAREMYYNIQKRMNGGMPMQMGFPKKDLAQGGTAEADEEDVQRKKAPVMLQRVLFRKPVDGDDDEIPQHMLVDAFAEIDGDGSGNIDIEELVEALRLCGLNVSKGATETIMREIDKNADGNINLREWIDFFRHIEDLNRFQKKTAARQQFLTFLLNFCFLADIIVVGVLLMIFIRMDEGNDPDNYSIVRNVLLACAIVLGILFLLVILGPILRLALGPSASKMQMQYEIAQEIKKNSKKSLIDESASGGPRKAGYSPDDPPPPVNSAMFGRSYRPGKVDQVAWSPQIEDLPPPRTTQSQPVNNQQFEITSHVSGNMTHAPTQQSRSHVRGGAWRYDPSNYDVARDFAEMQAQRNQGPMTWSPLQVREAGISQNTTPAVMPGAPMAITDAAMPYGGYAGSR